MSEYSYFIKCASAPEQEVTKEDFIKIERSCGFHPKSGDGIATHGFSSGSIKGRVAPFVLEVATNNFD